MLETKQSSGKDTYFQEYGRDVDQEHDADGATWIMTEGTGVPRDCRVERLELKLVEVKQLYMLKCGADVDEDADAHDDADGTPGIQTSGTGTPTDGRVDLLETKQSSGKDMYFQEYGRDVDQEHDADGTTWIMTEGTGVPRDCRGLSEGALLTSKKASSPVILTWAGPRGLGHLRRHGYVHRDVKPDNIAVQDGCVRLIQACQLRGPPTDIYSLGLVARLPGCLDVVRRALEQPQKLLY